MDDRNPYQQRSLVYRKGVSMLSMQQPKIKVGTCVTKRAFTNDHIRHV